MNETFCQTKINLNPVLLAWMSSSKFDLYGVWLYQMLTSPERSVCEAVDNFSWALIAETSRELSEGCNLVRSSFKQARLFISSIFSCSPVKRDCWMFKSSVRMAVASSIVRPCPLSMNFTLTLKKRRIDWHHDELYKLTCGEFPLPSVYNPFQSWYLQALAWVSGPLPSHDERPILANQDHTWCWMLNLSNLLKIDKKISKNF